MPKHPRADGIGASTHLLFTRPSAYQKLNSNYPFEAGQAVMPQLNPRPPSTKSVCSMEENMYRICSFCQQSRTDVIAGPDGVCICGGCVETCHRALCTDASLKVFDNLTPRQRAVLALVAEGLTNRQIAATLHLREGTIRNYVSDVLAKLDVCSRAGAAAYAARYNISPPAHFLPVDGY